MYCRLQKSEYTKQGRTKMQELTIVITAILLSTLSASADAMAKGKEDVKNLYTVLLLNVKAQILMRVVEEK